MQSMNGGTWSFVRVANGWGAQLPIPIPPASELQVVLTVERSPSTSCRWSVDQVTDHARSSTCLPRANRMVRCKRFVRSILVLDLILNGTDDWAGTTSLEQRECCVKAEAQSGPRLG